MNEWIEQSASQLVPYSSAKISPVEAANSYVRSTVRLPVSQSVCQSHRQIASHLLWQS